MTELSVSYSIISVFTCRSLFGLSVVPPWQLNLFMRHIILQWEQQLGEVQDTEVLPAPGILLCKLILTIDLYGEENVHTFSVGRCFINPQRGYCSSTHKCSTEQWWKVTKYVYSSTVPFLGRLLVLSILWFSEQYWTFYYIFFYFCYICLTSEVTSYFVDLDY